MMFSNLSKPRRWRLSVKLLVFLSLATVLGFSAVCARLMIDMRRSEEGLAQQTSENLATTISADISRNIEVFDLSLRAVSTNLMSPGIDGISPELRHLILFDHAATAKHFGAIQVFDASGRLTIDASTFDPQPASAVDQEFFRVHRDHADVGLFVSRPTLYRGAYSVIMSRRISDRNGDFAGVVAGAIRFSYFHDLLGRLRLGDNDIITVLRNDGIIIMRTPFDLDVVGKDVSKAPGLGRTLAEPSGTSSGVSAIDGIARLFVWRHVDGNPLIVVVGKPWANVYAIWNEQAMAIGVILVMLTAVAAAMTLSLAREIGRRSRAEARLEELATTDGLTGVCNRRKFDHDIDLEWRRAARSSAPLSLLLIDADHFKSYNDRFGHQEGDKALKAVAACIAQSGKRPGDCAARYGGEEFALLLPGVRTAEAIRIAEAVRLRVMRLSGNPAPLTVSIGVATLIPDARSAPAVLIEMADRALYDAKHAGRNRSCLAGVKPEALVA